MARNDFGTNQKKPTTSAGGGVAKRPKTTTTAPMPMKTANYPGPPGPTQRKDRSGGFRRVKDSPQKVGL